MATVTMRSLLEAGIHFGHQTRRWNPKMARYIFGERHGIYIIDLQQTLRQLRKAYLTARDAAAKGGKVLFVGTKKQARETIQREADRCEMYYVNNRWLGGTLTNWETIQRSIRSLVRLEDIEDSGKIEAYPKKEGIKMRKEREKLDHNLRGIKNMDGLPSVMFVIDSHKEAIAVKEAKRLNIPCIAIVDTNSDPDAVQIPVPGNDDAIRAINLFASIIAEAVIEGRMAFEKSKEEEAENERSASAEKAVKSDKLAKLQSQQVDGAETPDAAAESAAESAATEAPAAPDAEQAPTTKPGPQEEQAPAAEAPAAE